MTTKIYIKKKKNGKKSENGGREIRRKSNKREIVPRYARKATTAVYLQYHLSFPTAGEPVKLKLLQTIPIENSFVHTCSSALPTSQLTNLRSLCSPRSSHISSLTFSPSQAQLPPNPNEISFLLFLLLFFKYIF